MNGQSQLKELTCGYLGHSYFHYCLPISFREEGLVINLLFKKISIPIQYIDKLSSEEISPLNFRGIRVGGMSFNKGLKVTHHYPEAPENIWFVSTDWNAWFETFEKYGISVEDKEQLRYSNTTGMKWAKRLNLSAGLLGLLVPLIGLLILSYFRPR